MKRYPGIDYAYRPSSYWEDETPAQAIIKNIKGDFRREEIRKALAAGTLETIPEEILQETLSDNVRTFTGRIHPRFMGGEYLPDFKAEEVEIARISLASTTNDIISIRAKRRKNGRIHYSIADEYQGAFTFQLSRKTSSYPLTLGQMVSFLENSSQDEIPGNLIVGYNNMNADNMDPSERESLRHFTRIGSEFYPQLGRHCEHVFQEWVDEDSEPDKEEDD